MLLTTAVSCFLAFWSLLFLADFYLRVFSVHWYISFADHIGLSVSFFQVRFYTNRFHQSLLYQSLAVSSPHRYSLITRLVSVWFTLGATVSLVCFFGITAYLTKLLWDFLADWWPSYTRSREQLVPSIFHLNQADSPILATHVQRQTNGEVGLTPVIPGVNVPWEHLPLFLFVLAIVGIIHELGHALAAVDANVPVSGFGIFLIAVYPGAFTEMETEALGRSTSAQKMRIFGAGIWHNLVLAFIGYLLLLGVPYMLSPLFMRDSGVLVRDIDLRSGLSGTGGLRKNDVVYAINGCSIKNSEDWYRCLREIKEKKVGFCVPDEEILRGIATKVESYDGEIHCCAEFLNVSLSHICFYFKNETNIDKKNKHILDFSLGRGISLAPNLAESLGLKTLSKQNIKAHEPKAKVFSQRDARQVEHNQNSMNFNGFSLLNKKTVANNGTSKKAMKSEKYACLPARPVTDHFTCAMSSDCEKFAFSRKSTCIFPALFNGTSLLRIHVGKTSRPVLFIGTTNELAYFVKLSNHVPLYFFAFPWLPHVTELFSKYLVTFSLAVALLNAVPCYGLDGQFISKTLIDCVFAHFPLKRRFAINRFVMFYGVAVLGGNLFVGFVRFLRPYLT